MTARPTLTVEIAWGADVTEVDPYWYDESDAVRELRIARGRRRSRGEVEVGTCSMLLNNHDRRYDPTGEAFGADVRPATPVRVQATHEGTTYGLFYGQIESINPGWRPGNVAFARIDCVDGLKRLAALEAPGDVTLPNIQTVGERMNQLLDLAGWPSGAIWRDMATSDPSVFLQDWQIETGDNLMALIRKTAEAEGGLFHVNGSGRFIEQGRFWRSTYSYPWLFGEGGHPIVSFEMSYDDTDLINEVTIQSRNGSPRTATAPDSIIDRYSKRARAYTDDMNMVMTQDNPGVLAAWIVNQAQFPLLTGRLELLGELDTTGALWMHILNRGISDRVRVVVTPPNDGDDAPIDHQGWIDHIQHTITPSEWRCAWMLAPEGTNGWLLGLAGRSELGETTILPI